MAFSGRHLECKDVPIVWSAKMANSEVKIWAQVDAKYKVKATKFPEHLAIPLEDVASIEDEDLEVYHVGT